MVSEIVKEIYTIVPKDKISDAVFEGANIVLYTKDKDFFTNDEGLVRKAVNHVKKRIELRPDPSLCVSDEQAELVFKKLVPEEAGMGDIIFDHQRSVAIVEAEKPGLVIGKQGELLRELKNETFWVPQVTRKPPIRSEITDDIRSVLYENSDHRRKFLNRVGERVYNGWLRQKKEEWVRVTYLGGARETGRSALFLQTPESRILIDCGIDTTSEKNAYPFLECPEFRIEELDAIIITQAGLDHMGFLPYLFKFGYRGPVYCTSPTRDIMSLIQLDMVKIMTSEGRDALFSGDDIREVVKHTITLDYEEVTDVTPDIRLTFYNSGHLLGSAMAHIHVGNGLHNMLYTSDIKYARTNLLAAAVTKFPRLETLMVEGTYGGKDNIMPSVREQDKYITELITKTIERKGKVLIPTLGVGRGQDILVLVDKLIKQKIIPKIPIYIHGMVWDVTAIYTAYPEFLSNSVRSQIFHKDNNPFLSEHIKQVESVQEKEDIMKSKDPCIVLATSGTLIGGPSVDYLKGFCEDEKNTLIFSCYQPDGTLGKRILKGERDFTFKNGGSKTVTKELKMEIANVEVSGHADRRELMAFIAHCNPRPKRVLINHGEPSRLMDLASSVHKSLRVETVVPRNLDSLRIR